MIDLHSHILPGLDDGPATLAESLDIARAAVAAGTRTLTATPHIRADHDVDPFAVRAHVDHLAGALADAGIELELVAGGEVSMTELDELDGEALRAVCIGGGDCVLVESPYTQATINIERMVFDLQVRGLRPLLAHPERSPAFHSDPQLLARLVERGVLTSVTALSMAGRFGRRVQQFTLGLFAVGMVHNVSSDAHDTLVRPPGLLAGFEAAEAELPGAVAAAHWFVEDAPAALLAGEPLPGEPPALGRRRRWWGGTR